jgi:hypothetical protein
MSSGATPDTAQHIVGINTMSVSGVFKEGKKTFEVSLTLALDASDPIASARAYVKRLAETGFTPNTPNTETHLITHVIRRKHEDDKGVITPVIEFWNARGKYRICNWYLNTPADVEMFERESGVRLADLPLYIGGGSIERGKSPDAMRCMRALPYPVKVHTVTKEKKVVEDGVEKMKSRILFSRIEGTRSSGEALPAGDEPSDTDSDEVPDLMEQSPHQPEPPVSNTPPAATGNSSVDKAYATYMNTLADLNERYMALQPEQVLTLLQCEDWNEMYTRYPKLDDVRAALLKAVIEHHIPVFVTKVKTSEQVIKGNKKPVLYFDVGIGMAKSFTRELFRNANVDCEEWNKVGEHKVAGVVSVILSQENGYVGITEVRNIAQVAF